MKTIEDYTLDQLNAEIRRRKQVAAEEELERRSVEAARINGLLSHELIDLMVPSHDRSSCSDTSLSNGFDSAEYGTRCRRCALLQGYNEGWDPNYEITDFSIKKLRAINV